MHNLRSSRAAAPFVFEGQPSRVLSSFKLPFTALAVVALFTVASAAKAQTASADPADTPATAEKAAEREEGLPLPVISVEAMGLGSLLAPTAKEAEKIIDLTPGGVEVVPDRAWQDTPAATLKDVLDYTPGVFVQPKWGEDSRLSIRGSGLSRNFHLRGIAFYHDGIPFNASDGGGDFQEIDPTAYRYVEVYKGANALQYGAGTLGGAINFVSPTGYDADLLKGRFDFGSFGFQRYQASGGANNGVLDGFVTISYLAQDGFRDHSAGNSARLGGNFGWRISDNIETRLYFTLADIWQQIPGTVTKQSALEDPKAANPGNVALDYQRNIKSWRLASKTAVVWDETTLEFGAFAVGKQLLHPIYQYLDYDYHDFGGFARIVHEDALLGHANRFVFGGIVAAGWVDNSQYLNDAGSKGALLSKSKDRSWNTMVYGENSFHILPDLALVAGLQYVHASRDREDLLPNPPDTSGQATYDFFNPKGGLLWQAGAHWQVFGNVSRSGEAPTFSELNFTNTALADLKPQRATTLEIGTRGDLGDVRWDLSLYRAYLRDEFQFFDLGGGNYQVTNADRTLHQGIEFGGSWTFLRGLFASGEQPDQLWLHGAYTFNDFRFRDDPEWGNNKLPGAPPHYIRAELLYQHPSGLALGPNLEWVPRAYYVDNANTMKTQPYALLGFRVEYAYQDWFSLYLDARNLTNEAYISSANVVAVATPNSAIFEPGTGRAIYGGLRLAW